MKGTVLWGAYGDHLSVQERRRKKYLSSELLMQESLRKNKSPIDKEHCQLGFF